MMAFQVKRASLSFILAAGLAVFPAHSEILPRHEYIRRYLESDPELLSARQTVIQIERLLLARHRGEKDFRVINFFELIAHRMEQQKKHQKAVMAMGLVCLIAGGIGIMNVTLSVLYSRIKEIGIRRALGASRADILLQFSIEAALLGFLGGILGIFIGHAGVHFFIKDLQWAQIASLSPLHYLLIFSLAGGTGFLFAVWPAWQAAKLDPVEALRCE